VTGEIALAYVLLWIAGRSPRWYRRLGWKNDYSYGIYIYAFPVQQLLAQVRLHTVSYWLYVLATFAIVVPPSSAGTSSNGR
jgi:peptidoglycan/LPS O-acetylase OafA/YrhL